MRVQIGQTVWDKAAIQRLIDEDDRAVGRALMVVYGNQTYDEQESHATKHSNGMGFTGRDADWLTDIAKKWQRWGRWASEKQCNAVRLAIKKYWRQMLEKMAEREDAVVLSGRRKSDSDDVTAPEPAILGLPAPKDFEAKAPIAGAW